jgi:hypothetical protein
MTFCSGREVHIESADSGFHFSHVAVHVDGHPSSQRKPKRAISPGVWSSTEVHRKAFCANPN